MLDMAREYNLGGGLPLEGNSRRHWSRRARTEHGDLECGPGLRDRCLGRGRLIAAMGHAVRAFFVAASPVRVPVRGVHQFTERLGITFAEQVTGFLPTEYVAGGHAPRRAVIGLVSSEKVEIKVRVDEIPFLTLAHAEDLAEQFLGLSPTEEVFLVRRALVCVTRRDRHADAELLAVIEESRDVCGRVPVKDRGAHVDGEALRFGGLDGRYGAIEHARLTDRLVMVLAQPIEVDGKEEIRRRLEQMQLLLQKQRVRAERNELLLGDQPLHDLADLAVDQRLAAGDRHHGCAALVGGIEALFDGEPPIENWIGIIDLAATDASQIATKQRL